MYSVPINVNILLLLLLTAIWLSPVAVVILHVKGKAIPLQALTGPDGSRRLRLPNFMTIGT
jgi:hypothetical protein